MRGLLWFLLFVALLLVIWSLSSTKTENGLNEHTEPLVMLQGNTLIPISPVYFPHTFVYGTLISCLNWHETEKIQKYEGDKGYNCDNVLFESPYCAFGPLQFWQTTFKGYCMDKYNLTSNPMDIYDKETSMVCADKMLRDNFNNVYKWTTQKYCLN